MSRRVGVLSAVVGMFELFRPSVTRRLREAPLFETSFRTEYCNATTLQRATLAGDLDVKAQGRPPSIFFARLLSTRDYCCMNFSFQPEPIFIDVKIYLWFGYLHNGRSRQLQTAIERNILHFV